MATERNAQGVDVLAVMDFHIADLAGQGTRVNQRNELIEARAAVAELAESHAELLAWVERAIVPGYTDRKPMPENCRKAIARFQTGGAK